MARVIQLTEEQLIEDLRNKFSDCEKRMQTLKVELDICRRVYQNISLSPPAGLDAGLMTQYLAPSNDAATEEMMVAGLELPKCLNFLHGKLCISDPLVTSRARNLDVKNKRASECAEMFIPHFKDHTNLQERLEAGTFLNVVVDGNGVYYVGWDTDGGAAPSKPPVTNPDGSIEITMEGDFDCHSVSIDRFYIDAAAKTFLDANYVFEELDMDVSKAVFKFPDKIEIIKDALEKRRDNPAAVGVTSMSIDEQNKDKSTITVYHYWEKGTPWNGFNGAWVIFTEPKEPKILFRGPNPFKHKKLPYELYTDIDIPDNPYGQSRIIYCAQVQQSINTLLSMILDNIALHGSVHLIAPEGATNAESIKNSADKVWTYDPGSGGKIEQMQPKTVTTDVWRLYDIFKVLIENYYGMNEFSQGNIPRELSSFAVQLALEMDDKYRLRLFNKKKMFLKNIYTKALSIAQQFVSDRRKLKIVGTEMAPKLEYYSAADLDGDYDISVDYGTYLPIDPAARKQQIIELFKSGMYEKAGGNVRKLMSLLVDGDLLDAKFDTDKSREIQNSEIDKIIDGEEVGINEWDDNESHAAAVNDFCRTQFFEHLDKEIKSAIWKHGTEHIDELAQKMAEGGGQPTQPGQPVGQGAPSGGLAPDANALNPGATPPGAAPDAGVAPPQEQVRRNISFE
jgi:hypothetical protein